MRKLLYMILFTFLYLFLVVGCVREQSTYSRPNPQGMPQRNVQYDNLGILKGTSLVYSLDENPADDTFVVVKDKKIHKNATFIGVKAFKDPKVKETKLKFYFMEGGDPEPKAEASLATGDIRDKDVIVQIDVRGLNLTPKDFRIDVREAKDFGDKSEAYMNLPFDIVEADMSSSSDR